MKFLTEIPDYRGSEIVISIDTSLEAKPANQCNQPLTAPAPLKYKALIDCLNSR